MPNLAPTISIAISSTPENEPFVQSLASILNALTHNISVFRLPDSPAVSGDGFDVRYVGKIVDSTYFILIFGGGFANGTAEQLFYLGSFLSNNEDRKAVIINEAAIPTLTTTKPNVGYFAATPDGLSKFLTWLIRDLGPAFDSPRELQSIIRHVEDESVRLADSFVGGMTSQHFVPRIEILLERDKIDIKSIGKARIRADSATLKLLGMLSGNWTIEDIRGKQSDKKWIDALSNNLYAVIVENRLPSPALYLMQSGSDRYLPVIVRVDRRKQQGFSILTELIKWRGEPSGESFFRKAFFGAPVSSKIWPDVFVAMPFSPALDPVYRDHIVPVIKNDINGGPSR